MTYLFLDSNIFLQFQDFEQIKWSEICGTDKITIVVTGTVIREIDKKKDSSRSKLRDRAKRIGKKINKVLRGELQCKYPLIYVSFPKKETMDSPTFNKDISDDWIVHTVNDFELRCDSDEKIIISNDYNVYCRALSFHILVYELPEKYLLPQELSDEEKKIRELESRIAAYENSCANTYISFADGTQHLHLDFVERPDFSCRKDEIRAFLEANVPFKSYAPQNPAQILLSAIQNFTLTEDDYRVYNSLLPEYYEKESEFLYLKEICDFIDKNMIPLSFHLENNGAAQSGFIGLYMDFAPDAIVYTDNARISYEANRVKKPELKSVWQRKLEIPIFPPTYGVSDKLFSWNIDKTEPSMNLSIFNEYNPIIHQHPPVAILDNTFYVFKGIRQQFAIRWRLIDSLSPIEKNGELTIDVS